MQVTHSPSTNRTVKDILENFSLGDLLEGRPSLALLIETEQYASVVLQASERLRMDLLGMTKVGISGQPNVFCISEAYLYRQEFVVRFNDANYLDILTAVGKTRREGLFQASFLPRTVKTRHAQTHART